MGSTHKLCVAESGDGVCAPPCQLWLADLRGAVALARTAQFPPPAWSQECAGQGSIAVLEWGAEVPSLSPEALRFLSFLVWPLEGARETLGLP